MLVAGVLGVWLGADDVVLCVGLGVSDGLGVCDGLGLPVWLSATATKSAVDPAAHGEWVALACRAGATDAASAGASAEPDSKNTPPAIKTAVRTGRPIPIGTAALR